MKIEALHMSAAEQEIMEYLWREQKPVTAADIIDGLPHRKWKPSTVHTIVMHMIDEGFVKYYKAGGKNYYIPYISDFDYSFVVTKAFVNIMHGGSIVEIVRTLLCDLELNREELEELSELVDSAVYPQESVEPAEKIAAEKETEEVKEAEDVKETEELIRLNGQSHEKAVFSPIWILRFYRPAYSTYDYMDEAGTEYLSSA